MEDETENFPVGDDEDEGGNVVVVDSEVRHFLSNMVHFVSTQCAIQQLQEESSGNFPVGPKLEVSAPNIAAGPGNSACSCLQEQASTHIGSCLWFWLVFQERQRQLWDAELAAHAGRVQAFQSQINAAIAKMNERHVSCDFCG